MNPRVSRSCALASKATGFPIAKIAARLAVGYTLAGDPQRHHPGDAGELRAGDRLLRRQVAAVRVREVPRRRGRPDHAHEVGRRGDGDRAHVQAGVRQGAALARARRRRRRSPPTTRSCSTRVAEPGRRALRPAARGAAPRRDRSTSCTARTSIDPWFLRELARARRRPGGAVRRRADVQVGRHLRRRVRRRARRTTTRAGSARRRTGRAHEVAPRRARRAS